MALSAKKEGSMLDELKRPRISIDLFSERGQYLSARRIHPLPEQITAVVEGCLLVIEKLGEIGKMIEAIKISFSQKETADYLLANLTIYMVEPWTFTAAESSRGKIKVETQVYAKKLRHTPDSFHPDQVAERVLINVASNFIACGSIHKEMAQKIDNLLSKELTSYV